MNNEISIPVWKAYKIALLLMPVIFILFGVPYLILWFEPFTQKLTEALRNIFIEGRLLLLLPYVIKAAIALITGIFLHEALHGLGWVFFARRGLRSLKFGFTSHEMAPYAHCKDPLPVYAYRIGIILPGLLLGIIPGLLAILSGHFLWLLYGIFFTWAASGDFIMLWMIRGLSRNSYILDHPGKLGCIIS